MSDRLCESCDGTGSRWYGAQEFSCNSCAGTGRQVSQLANERAYRRMLAATVGLDHMSSWDEFKFAQESGVIAAASESTGVPVSEIEHAVRVHYANQVPA